MRIGIEGILLRDHIAGSHRYFDQLIAGLGEYGNVNDYIVFANLPKMRNVVPPPPHLTYRHVRTSAWLPDALQQQFFRGWGDLDLLHSAVFVPPASYPHASVMTLFDLTFALFPETMHWTGRLWWRVFVPRGLSRARRIITLAESTRRDLMARFHLAPKRVRVIYPCVRDFFRPVVRPDVIAKKYSLPENYILYVGTLERRKNIPTLIEAFALTRRMGDLPHTLVLAGQPGWLYQDIFEMVRRQNLSGQVRFLGYVPDEDLPALYSHADLFAYLSLYEGFGLPPLEAMACGVPVLVSNTSALPEVVGEAGVLVAPRDVPTIASEMMRVLRDSDLRAEMRVRGLERAQLFTPQKMIEQTLQVYDEAIRG